jgi:polysaccharide deacetylase 2 family uncharacterized protein YibQ
MTPAGRFVLPLILIALPLMASADPPPEIDDAQPVIAVIIDDLGDLLEPGRRAIALPGVSTFAILPQTPHAASLARTAHEAGKEVFLHQPLDATEPGPLGPGAIHLDMDRETMARTLDENLASVPFVVGVNNHMGSMLTMHPGHMDWLMQALAERDLIFVDSRTTTKTVAMRLAAEHRVPALERDVFIDPQADGAAILEQLARLRQVAQTQGYAIAIAHPYPVTLDILERALPDLIAEGFRLVSASELIRMRTEQMETASWPVSSSR